MLLALLVYAYCQGVRSSRQIERSCVTDVAFRVLCAQYGPDHATIARFRAEARDMFTDLFSQVLMVATEAGLGRPRHGGHRWDQDRGERLDRRQPRQGVLRPAGGRHGRRR
jgi:Transposase domain (DUF772)